MKKVVRKLAVLQETLQVLQCRDMQRIAAADAETRAASSQPEACLATRVELPLHAK